MMINLAVVNLKDILKYLLKIIIVLIILWLFSKFFLINKETSISIENDIDTSKLLICLDETIPGIKQLNDNDVYKFEQNNIEKIEPLKLLLNMQIGMINNIKLKNETNKNIAITNEIEQAQTRLRYTSN
jgi:hypothetical protein